MQPSSSYSSSPNQLHADVSSPYSAQTSHHCSHKFQTGRCKATSERCFLLFRPIFQFGYSYYKELPVSTITLSQKCDQASRSKLIFGFCPCFWGLLRLRWCDRLAVELWTFLLSVWSPLTFLNLSAWRAFRHFLKSAHHPRQAFSPRLLLCMLKPAPAFNLPVLATASFQRDVWIFFFLFFFFSVWLLSWKQRSGLVSIAETRPDPLSCGHSPTPRRLSADRGRVSGGGEGGGWWVFGVTLAAANEGWGAGWAVIGLYYVQGLMSESVLIPVTFVECVLESRFSLGFAWSDPNFRFASMAGSETARLTQFPAPFPQPEREREPVWAREVWIVFATHG